MRSPFFTNSQQHYTVFLAVLIFSTTLQLFLTTTKALAITEADPLEIELEDSVVSRLYLALLDRDVENALKPDYLQGNESLVEMAQLAAGFNFAYFQKGSKYFQDPLLEEAVLRIVQPIYKYQTPEGTLVTFSNKKIDDHLTAQIIECLIYISPITQKFNADIQNQHERFIENGLNYLKNIENTTMDYHKAILCGVLALGAHHTGQSEYQNASNQWLQHTSDMFKPDGQVLEGPGPDLIYSVTSIRYLFLYRLLSNDKELDPVLINSLKWITKLFTVETTPLEGMSTENWVDDGLHLATLLSALTFYSDEDISFEQYATYYMNSLIDSSRPVSFIDGTFTFFKAAQFHEIPEKLETFPYQPYAEIYETDHSLYCLVGKNYQTAITLRGRLPLKGLQTWSYTGHPPIIIPRPDKTSSVITTGLKSSYMDILWNQIPETYKLTPLSNNLDSLVVHQDQLQTAYIFSLDTTVVIYRIPQEIESMVQWNTNSYFGAQILDGSERSIEFENSPAKIVPPNILPNIIQDGHNRLLRYSIKNEFFWFTFAGPNSNVIIRPVVDGLVFVQLIENDDKTNVLINLSHLPFDKEIAFPGTSVPVPPIGHMTATIVE